RLNFLSRATRGSAGGSPRASSGVFRRGGVPPPKNSARPSAGGLPGALGGTASTQSNMRRALLLVRTKVEHMRRYGKNSSPFPSAGSPAREAVPLYPNPTGDRSRRALSFRRPVEALLQPVVAPEELAVLRHEAGAPKIPIPAARAHSAL